MTALCIFAWCYPIQSNAHQTCDTDEATKIKAESDKKFPDYPNKQNLSILTISANGPTTFCIGGSVVLTSSLPSGNTWSNGSTTQSITVTNSGSHYCTNSGDTSNTIVVTVNPSPPATMSQTDSVVLCSGTLIKGPVSGNAANFDGVDDSIKVANPLSAANSFTFEAWVYWKGGNNWQRVFSFGNNLGNNFYFTPQSNSGLPMLDIVISNSGQHIESTTALGTNAWHHVAVTLSGGTGKIYIDGILTGTNSAYAYTPAALGATIHNYLSKSEYPTDPYYNGYLDEVRFWNLTRTQAQIQSNMNKTVATNSSGLVAYYKLDESTGTSVRESVSGSTTATANNGLAWLVPSTVGWNPASYLWSDGKTTQSNAITAAGAYTLTVTAVNGCTAFTAPLVVTKVNPKPSATITPSGPTTFCQGGNITLSAPEKGNALQFDGSNDYAVSSTPVIPVSGKYTVLFWAKELSHQGGYREILSQGRKFYIGRDNTGIIRVGDDWLNTGVAWPTDLQWHHYGVVRTNSNAFLYIDGNLVATKGSPINNPIVWMGAPNLFIIGEQWDLSHTEVFHGQVDEITIWNYDRTQVQIKNAMNSSVSTSASGLVAYYKLDEGAGTTVLNAVNSGDTCVMTNGPLWVVPSGFPNNITSYSWSTGSTTQSINVNSKATYTVTVANSYGCTKTATKKVIVNSLPSGAVSASGPLTFCAGDSVTFTASSGNGYTYQWSKNSVNINGATNISYTATTAGTYKVIVTKTNGCSKASANKIVTINCREDNESIQPFSLSVYPDPASDAITVSFDNEMPNALLRIMNTAGQVVLQQVVETTDGNFEEPISVSGLAPGVYHLEIISGSNRSNIRFVKQ